MKFTLHIHVITALVATSYVTLGLFAPSDAKRLWWAYAIVTFILAVLDLKLESREREIEQEKEVRRGKEDRGSASPHHA